MSGAVASSRRAMRVISLLILAAFPRLALAELRVERLQTDERSSFDGELKRREERTQFVFVAEGAVRFDNGPTSIIVRLEDGVYIHLDHGTKTYAELTLPLKLEDLLTDQEKACLRQFPQALAGPEATVTLTDERRTIGRREARKIRIEWANFVGLAFEEERWVSHGLPPEVGLYLDLEQSRAALSPAYRGWIDQVVEFGGYPIESTRTLQNERGVRVVRQRLIAVTEIEPDKVRYRPPRDYSPTLGRPPLDVACLGQPEP